MALPLIQSIAGSITSGTSAQATFANNVSPGSTIIVAVGYAGTGAMNLPTDSFGSTYATTVTLSSSSLDCCLKIAQNVPGGPCTVTQTVSVSGNALFICMEFAGITATTASILDPSTGTGSRNAASASVATISSFRTTQPEDLLVGAAFNNGSATYTAPAGYQIVTTASGTMGLGATFKYQSAPALITNPTFMTQSSGAVTYTAVIASYLTTMQSTNNYRFVKVGDGMSATEKIR